MTETTRLEGTDAIAYAEAHDMKLCKYTDPIEEAREGLTVDEARQVAAEDPSLIYLEIPSARQIYRAIGDTSGWCGHNHKSERTAQACISGDRRVVRVMTRDELRPMEPRSPRVALHR